MIYDDVQHITAEDFRREFNKKFANFCKKSPLILSYLVAGDVEVHIFLHSDSNDLSSKSLILTHRFNFSKSVKGNIFDIRKELVRNWYPLMEQLSYRDVSYSPQELNAMVERGEISIDDVSSNMFREPYIVTHRVEKSIVTDNKLLVRNLDTKALHQYRLKMPVATFVRRINNMTYRERWELFEQKAVYERTIDENPELTQALTE